MANSYYDHTTYPATGASGSSAALRAELDTIEAGFDAVEAAITTPTITGDLTFTGTGNRITGDFSNATVANRVMFQTSTVNGNTIVSILPNGTATICGIKAYGASDPTNAISAELQAVGAAETRLSSVANGSASAAPMTFFTGGAERLRIDTSGNVLVKSAAGLGYGTGAGGTVTQDTSKGTLVTLHKPCGQITMHNYALAANTVVNFQLTNSLISDTDVLNVSFRWNGVLDYGSYQVWAAVANGSAIIFLKNITGASKSEVVELNFTIIKGVTS